MNRTHSILLLAFLLTGCAVTKNYFFPEHGGQTVPPTERNQTIQYVTQKTAASQTVTETATAPAPDLKIVWSNDAPSLAALNIPVGATCKLWGTSDLKANNWALLTAFVYSSPTNIMSFSNCSSTNLAQSYYRLEVLTP